MSRGWLWLCWIWPLGLLLLPLVIVLRISLAEPRLAQPPYSPLWDVSADGAVSIDLHLDNYRLLLEDPLYVQAWLDSLGLAAGTALLCLVLAYPMAWAIAASPPRRRRLFLLLVMLPFWTSLLLRIYAWMGLLAPQGMLSQALLRLGVTEAPLAVLHSPTAVFIGMVYAYLPFMLLPIHASLDKLDPQLLEAAADLGCRPWQAFLRVALPLSLPGVLGGTVLVFVPALGEFVIPDLLGGPGSLLLGQVLWNEFFANRAWPVAAALALTLLGSMALFLLTWQFLQRRLGALA
ncbi:MAG: ABC transporter permease subunit [Gammaproteobacteria bacterium]|nr:ABC transporter permease subunit [Gammaproteobacteria bacterium]